MVKTKLSVFLDQNVAEYIKEKAKKENRRPGNFATYLLTQKVHDQILKEANTQDYNKEKTNE